MTVAARDPAQTRLSPRLQWILLAAIVLAVSLVRLRLVGVPLERDEGDYAYGAQLLLQGLLPYRDFYTMRMPGIYLVYALPIGLLGHDPAAIHLALLVAHAATLVLLFLIGRRLVDPVAGLLAAAFYAALCLGGFTLGLFANSEHFVVLLAMAGIALLVCAGERTGRLRLLAAGVLLGSTVIVKQHGAFFVAFGALLALVGRAGGPAPGGARSALARLATYAAGAAIPFAGVCVLVALLDLWQPFWFWTFEYARIYVSSVPAEQGLGRLRGFAPRILLSAPLVWGLAAAGVGAVLWDRSLRPRGLWLIALAALSTAAVSIGLYYRAHYFILLFPALALLAAAGARGLAAGAGARAPAAAALLGALAVAWVLVYERQPLFRDTPLEVAANRYGANPFPESLEISRYLREHTEPGDRLLVLGSEPQIPFYAQRNSVTPHIYMYPLMEAHPFADDLQRQLIRDAEDGRPAFIVVTHVSSSWLSHRGSSRRVYDWMYRYIPRFYRKVGLVEIDRESGSRFYWDDDARGRVASTEHLIQVFERSDRRARRPADP